MITLFTGMPGAGKTAAMIDLLQGLAKDRPVFVHFDEKERLRPEQKLLSETLLIPHTRVNAATWHEEVSDGGILIIDEAQGCWRPRGPAAKVPESIAALETHRHAGVDIFLTTQAPRLIDANARGLVGRHVHIRDTGWLGRWWYEWPECNEGLQWKTCPVKKRYKLPSNVFDVYASANEHHAPVRTSPKTLALVVVLLLCLGVLIFLIVRSISGHTSGDASKPKDAATSGVVASSPAAKPGLIEPDAPDERVAFMPRLSNRPWTAPAYDDLRRVVAVPYITGAICVNGDCACYHGKRRIVEVDSAACLDWAKTQPFNAYEAAETASDRRASPEDRTGAAPPSSAAVGRSSAGGPSML